MRLCIGTPDFTSGACYSYNDLTAGETDPELKRFTEALSVQSQGQRRIDRETVEQGVQ